jgi:hypothetical protein
VKAGTVAAVSVQFDAVVQVPAQVDPTMVPLKGSSATLAVSVSYWYDCGER